MQLRGAWWTVAFVLPFASVPRVCLCAQAEASPARDSTATLADGPRPFVSRRDALILAGALGATAAAAPFDHSIQHAFRAEDVLHSRGLQRTATALAFVGGPGPFVVSGTLYAAGEIVGSSRLAGLGISITEGVVLAASLNGVVKGISGRALPNATSAEPGDFSFGRGFHEGNGSFVSFPSGHTAAAFAAAAVVAQEVSTWKPAAARFVTPAVYSAASLVAMSRLYQNVHWASDLPLGAAIGVWSGKTVVNWQHRHPRNWLFRRIVHLSALPASTGLTVRGAFTLAAQ
jgi:membrane-associated phospholipid phosphatase